MGFEPTTPEGSGLAVEIKWEDIEEYLEIKRDERGWSIKHYAEEERRLRNFFNITKGVLNADSITEYIKAIKFYAKKRDYANTVARFLEWFSKRKGMNLSNEIELLRSVQRPKKMKKLYADSDRFTLTLNDIRKTLEMLIRQGDFRVASLVVLMASTGIRPEEACTITKKGMTDLGIQKSMINLNKDGFILPAEMSKTRVERVIPFHLDFDEVYTLFIENWDKEDLWNYNSVQKVIKKTPVKQLSRLRKFFVIHSAEIGFPEQYRIAIAGHDERDLLKLRVTEEFYRKFTPCKIVEVYLEYWGEVRFL